MSRIPRLTAGALLTCALVPACANHRDSSIVATANAAPALAAEPAKPAAPPTPPPNQVPPAAPAATVPPSAPPAPPDAIKPPTEAPFAKTDPIYTGLAAMFKGPNDGPLTPATNITKKQLMSTLMRLQNEGSKVQPQTLTCNSRGCSVEVRYKSPVAFAQHVVKAADPRSEFGRSKAGNGRTGLLRADDGTYMARWFLLNPYAPTAGKAEEKKQ